MSTKLIPRKYVVIVDCGRYFDDEQAAREDVATRGGERTAVVAKVLAYSGPFKLREMEE